MQKTAQSRFCQFADKLSTYYRQVVNWGERSIFAVSLSAAQIQARVKFICAQNPKLSERRMVQLYLKENFARCGEGVALATHGTGPIV